MNTASFITVQFNLTCVVAGSRLKRSRAGGLKCSSAVWYRVQMMYNISKNISAESALCRSGTASSLGVPL